MLGVDFEIYDILQELGKFNEIITFDINDKFDKKKSSSLELIFSELNSSFLKHIVCSVTRPVYIAPCEIHITQEQTAILNSRLKEKQDL